MIHANLGVAPWDVFHIGMYLQLGLTIGSWTVIVGLCIIAFTSLLSRSWPKAGAVWNMLLVGLFIDLFLLIPWIDTPSALWGKILLFTLGLLINGFGIGLYISPNCGAGPRDTLMLELTERTKWKVQHIRGSIEVVVLLFGWLLGGPVFIGTLIYTFGIGSIVGITLPRCQTMYGNLKKRFTEQSGGVLIEGVNKGQIWPNNHDGFSQ